MTASPSPYAGHSKRVAEVLASFDRRAAEAAGKAAVNPTAGLHWTTVRDARERLAA